MLKLWPSLTLRSLHISTSAAAANAGTARNLPTPIRCSCVSPETFPVYRLAIGITMLSWNTTQINMKITEAEFMEAAGIEKDPILVSIAIPCWIKVVAVWHIEAA
jgi:hypothetical protein